MKKKSIPLVLSTVFALTALTGCGGSSSNAPTAGAPGKTETNTESKPAKIVELNLGHTLVTDSHYHLMATKFAEVAAQKSNGTIKVSVFPQSQLGGEVKMIQSARTGNIGMLITAQAPLVNSIKEYGIFDLPYLFDSIEQANKVLNGDVGKKYLDMLPQHGLVGLGFLSAIERNVFSSKPVNKVEDLNGLKLRVIQSPGYVKTYETLGAQPTPMAYSEVFLSMQQKVIDGGEMAIDQFVDDKFIEVSKYFNKTKTHYLPALLLISKAKWDELTPEQQKVMQEAAKEAIQLDIDFSKKDYVDSIEQAKKAGIQVIEPDLTEFKKEAQKSYDSILNEVPNGKQLYDEIQAAKK